MRSLICLALLCTVPPVTAQNLWVDAAIGSDTNPGTAASPLRSITAAISFVTPNATIFIRPGIYSVATTAEQFPLQLGNGILHDGVTLYGFDGAVVDLANGRTTAVQVGTQANGGRITGLTFANMDQNDWWATTISAGSYNGTGSATGFEVDRCRFVDVNRGIVLWQGRPITGWYIHDNLFLRLGNDGINEFDIGSANFIHDNTFAGGAHLGVLSDADASVIANNVLTGLRVGIASSGSPAAAVTRVRRNALWQNSRDVEGAAFVGGLPASNYTSDPQFVNPQNDDYRPGATSPLIDAGDRSLPQRADLDRVPGAVDSDLNGSVVTDVGAYERTPVTVTATATNGVSLSFQVTSSVASLPAAFVMLGLDEGVIRLPGLSPILIEPGALVSPGLLAGMPYNATFPIPTVPVGARVIVQGFGFDPGRLLLIGGAAVRVQL